MKQNPLFLAAINGFLVVALGAFGAHALEARISTEMLDVYHTAVQYHMFHITGLIGLHLLQREAPALPGLAVIGHLFLAGIVLFCGSLYLLALTGLTWLGMITPLGGLMFLAAWVQLARASYRHYHR
jgi:uncharacterized membrane protein YgdD (TMEM256/DUF423 family)